MAILTVQNVDGETLFAIEQTLGHSRILEYQEGDEPSEEVCA